MTREIDVFSEPPEIDTTRADEPPSRLERCVRAGVCVRRSLAACLVCSLLLFAAIGIVIILVVVVHHRRVSSADAACLLGSLSDAWRGGFNASAFEAGSDCFSAAKNSSGV